MNVVQYPPVINSISLYELLREVDMVEPLPGNCWIGLHDEPENAIEKYILDSYDMYFKDMYPLATGFEWWLHIFKDCDRMVGFHSSHDEMARRENNGEMKYPFLSTVTYLNNHKSPTIVWDTSTGQREKEIINCPPTEVCFSLPEEGRMLTFNPRYINGVLPYSVGRITLHYDIWGYRPRGLNRVGVRTRKLSSQFFTKRIGEDPTTWLGDTCDTSVMLFGPDWKRQVTFKHPVNASNIGSFWKVIQ
jgi:hypothetical protein|tara:strand:- start:995 stop:1735 length:741 start_codon:yes stop_codon:yes gene_type:complete